MCGWLGGDICEYYQAIRDKRKKESNEDDRVKEASKGYYSDLNATRKHGGKTWVAPQTLIREDVSSINHLLE